MDKKEYKEGIFGLDVTVEGSATGVSTLAYSLEDTAGKTILQNEIPVKSRGLSNFITFDEQSFPYTLSYQRRSHFIISYKLADRKSTRLNSSHTALSRMPSSA